MKTDTRQKILETGARIVHRKGFNHTGIQEILEAAGVPKGSFYNYFKNKEDFGLHVIDYYVVHFEGLAQQMLDDTSLAPLKRLVNILNHFIVENRSIISFMDNGPTQPIFFGLK